MGCRSGGITTTTPLEGEGEGKEEEGIVFDLMGGSNGSSSSR